MIDFNIDNYLRISLTDVVLVCISTFLIVMFAKKFFWEKLLTLIQKRQDLIQENIDSSVAIKSRLKMLKNSMMKNCVMYRKKLIPFLFQLEHMRIKKNSRL